MSVIKSDRTNSIQVQINQGTASSPKYKKLTFNYLDPNAEPEKLLTLGNKIGACQTYDVEKIINVQKGSLIEE